MNVLRIDKSQAISNLRFFQSFGKKVTIMVKANAYGHGLNEIVSILKGEDVKLGVATIDEAKQLRKIWNKEILVVEPISEFYEVEDFQFVVDSEKSLGIVKNLGLSKNCFLKINVGMNRFGFDVKNTKIMKKALKIAKKMQIKGALTHFPSLVCEKETISQYISLSKMLKCFDDFSISLGGSNVYQYNFTCDEIRVGIGFYGYENASVRPIASLHSQILKIFELKKGEKLGYDGSFVSDMNVKVGIVGIGYGDGIDRKLTGSYVKIKGKKCKIIGKICMDCFFVDLSMVTAKEGDEVKIFDDAKEFADCLGTIPYEILTRCTSLRGKREIVAK